MPRGVYKHKPHIEKTKRKMRENDNKGWFKVGHKGYKAWLGKKLPKEHIKNIQKSRRKSGWWKDPKGAKKNMSESHKGQIPYKMTDNTRKKMSKAMKGKYVGEKHPNWQGGISFAPYPLDWTEDLKESIRKRDNYSCQLCERTQEMELKELHQQLSVHHRDYNKKNCKKSNLITLCNKCNIRVNYNRNYWSNYFIHYEKSNSYYYMFSAF